MADETIKVKAPKLQITKQSDKKVYAVGETGYYKLHITQGKEGMTAQNVKVVDEFEKEGMKVQKIEVKLNEKISHRIARLMRKTISLRLKQEKILVKMM